MHQLANPGKISLELIEVQVGSYLGENDVVRRRHVLPAASARYGFQSRAFSLVSENKYRPYHTILELRLKARYEMLP